MMLVIRVELMISWF